MGSTSYRFVDFEDDDSPSTPVEDSAADDPSMAEFVAPLVAASLEMLPISGAARDAATTLLDEVTTALRRQRHEKRARAEELVQKKIEEEKRQRAVAARMDRLRERERRAELRVERKAAERRQQREDDIMAALRRGAVAEATLAELEKAHWVEKMLVEAAREQARRLASAIGHVEEVGVSREAIEASLGLHVLEQSIATSNLVRNLLESAVDTAKSRVSAAAERKGSNSGPVA